MKNIHTEKQLYAELANRGDPSAFYALFHEHIRNLYILLKSQGKDHDAICAEAVQTVTRLYLKYVHHPSVNPHKWFTAGCGLKGFEAGEVRINNATEVDIEAYKKQMTVALNRAYGERLERGSDGKGNIRGERPGRPYIIGALAAAVLITFFFFSGAGFSISFGRFNSEFNISFPNMAEKFWSMSGFVRTVETGPTHTGGITPAQRQQDNTDEPEGGHE